MTRHYETVFIVKPDIGEAAIKEIIKKASALVEDDDGPGVDIDEWGRRRLAYPIQKNSEGHYVLFTYTVEPAASKELERMLKLNEEVLRFQTVALGQRPVKAAEAVKDSVGEEQTPEVEETRTEPERTEAGEAAAEEAKPKEEKPEEDKPKEEKTGGEHDG